MTPRAKTSLALYQEALATFDGLLDAARTSGDSEPTAMTLATADGAGRVSARVVLLKGVDEDGFRFYTNYDSAKGAQLAAHPQAALCFHWKLLRDGVQVRIEGAVSKTSDDDSDAYFATRARGSQIGAWASLQSQTLPNRDAFEATRRRVREALRRRPGAASAALGRLCRPAGPHRVLVRRAIPPARARDVRCAKATRGASGMLYP